MSHTATGEWKSFELRMRRRRVERLLLRADVAAEQGCRDEAHACLDEARSLAPGLPAIAAIERRLGVSGVPQPASKFRRSAPAARLAAASIGAAVVLAIWMRPHASLPSEDRRLTTLDAPAVESPHVELPPAPAPVATPPAAPAILPVVALDPLPRDEAPAKPLRARDGDATDDARALRPKPEAANESVATTVADVSNAVSAIANSASSAMPEARSLPAPSPAAVSPPVAAPAPDTAIRGMLNRYAAAYNDLDADAAARVWPGVNRSALQRAFDALASQRVSLGDCRIDVNGAAARADCAGSATWSARIGDRSPRTEARRWTFDFERAGDEWRIVGARAQNR